MNSSDGRKKEALLLFLTPVRWFWKLSFFKISGVTAMAQLLPKFFCSLVRYLPLNEPRLFILPEAKRRMKICTFVLHDDTKRRLMC